MDSRDVSIHPSHLQYLEETPIQQSGNYNLFSQHQEPSLAQAHLIYNNQEEISYSDEMIFSNPYNNTEFSKTWAYAEKEKESICVSNPTQTPTLNEFSHCQDDSMSEILDAIMEMDAEMHTPPQIHPPEFCYPSNSSPVTPLRPVNLMDVEIPIPVEEIIVTSSHVFPNIDTIQATIHNSHVIPQNQNNTNPTFVMTHFRNVENDSTGSFNLELLRFELNKAVEDIGNWGKNQNEQLQGIVRWKSPEENKKDLDTLGESFSTLINLFKKFTQNLEIQNMQLDLMPKTVVISKQPELVLQYKTPFFVELTAMFEKKFILQHYKVVAEVINEKKQTIDTPKPLDEKSSVGENCFLFKFVIPEKFNRLYKFLKLKRVHDENFFVQFSFNCWKDPRQSFQLYSRPFKVTCNSSQVGHGEPAGIWEIASGRFGYCFAKDRKNSLPLLSVANAVNGYFSKRNIQPFPLDSYEHIYYHLFPERANVNEGNMVYIECQDFISSSDKSKKTMWDWVSQLKELLNNEQIMTLWNNNKIGPIRARSIACQAISENGLPGHFQIRFSGSEPNALAVDWVTLDNTVISIIYGEKERKMELDEFIFNCRNGPCRIHYPSGTPVAEYFGPKSSKPQESSDTNGRPGYRKVMNWLFVS